MARPGVVPARHYLWSALRELNEDAVARSGTRQVLLWLEARKGHRTMTEPASDYLMAARVHEAEVIPEMHCTQWHNVGAFNLSSWWYVV
jgi:hypothetical protein